MFNEIFRLIENSPVIDMDSDQAADNLGLLEDIDGEMRKSNFSGLNRPQGFIDIGADEVSDLIFADGFDF